MKERTLIVIGAGASVDLKFPTGVGLRNKISAALKINYDGWNFQGGSKRICSYLSEQESSRRGDLINAASFVARNLPLADSIDSFLRSNPDPDVETISKMAICDVIADAEDSCALQTGDDAPDRFDFTKIENFWMTRLFARLHRPLSQGEGPEAIFRNVQFVTFNYDRVLEQFLTVAIGSFYKLPYGQAADLVDKLPIWHVYGSLGSLSQSNPNRAQFGVPFGSLQHLAGRIRTFSESTDPAEIGQLSGMMGWCRQFLFLGFSYAEMNTKLLSEACPKLTNGPVKRVYGTCMGMSSQNLDVVRAVLNGGLQGGYGDPKLLNLDCTRIFEDLSLVL